MPAPAPDEGCPKNGDGKGDGKGDAGTGDENACNSGDT